MLDVFVAAAGEVDDDEVVGAHVAGDFRDVGEGVGAFEGGDDAFGVGEFAEGGEGFVVGGVDVFGAANVLEVGVLRADGGVVESGADGVGEFDLAVVIGEEPGFGALEDAEFSALEAGGVFFGFDAFASGFDADHAEVGVIDEGVEEAHGIGAAADAGDEKLGEAAFFLEDLLAGFESDDAVEVADHHGERVGAEGGAENIMGVIDGGDPVAHGFVDGFFEGGLSGGDGDDFGPHEAHAGDIEGLARHVDFAHVDGAVHAEAGADGGGGDAVLTGSGFGDDAFFAEAFGEEDLADGVVDLMCSGVEEVFALKVDFGSAQFFGPAFGEVERGGASAVVVEEVVELGLEGGVGLGFFVGAPEVIERGHEGFGGETSSEFSEMAAGIWDGGGLDWGLGAHARRVVGDLKKTMELRGDSGHRGRVTRIAVLGSGTGSNFQALYEEFGDEIVVVISDQKGAGILEKAERFGIPAVYVPGGKSFEEKALPHLEGVDLVCLAGFMRLVKSRLLGAFPNRILNIHPSLLPKYPGLMAWRQAVDDGATESGCTVHYVDAGMDTGPVIQQARVPVLADDTAETLHFRIQKAEHQLYPEAVRQVLAEMDSSDKLERMKEEYTQARFKTPIADGDLPEHFFIVTACNPFGGQATAEENDENSEKLQQQIRNHGWHHFPATGYCDDHEEPGFGVVCSRTEALMLGESFRQDAIFEVKGGQVLLVDCKAEVEDLVTGQWVDLRD